MAELEQHHRYSASGAEGWMNCPGKIAMEQGLEDKPSKYADEGTAAHFLAAESLLNDKNADDYLGVTIVCYTLNGRSEQLFTDADSGIVLPEDSKLSSEWVVDADMASEVQKYIDRVRHDAEDGALLVEQRVEFGPAIDLPGAFGTADAGIITNDGKRIKIRDLKYGFKHVSAENNKQMMLYALGFLNSFEALLDESEIEEVDLSIIQPRTSSPDVPWSLTIPELREFAEEAKAAIALSEEALATVSPTTDWAKRYLNPTEKGCQWCKARAKCPALANESINQMVAPATTDGLVDLDASTDMGAVMDKALRAIPDVDFETLVKLYQVKDKIKIWIDAVNDRMLHDMLQGYKTPLFKLVKGRQGDRKWTSEVDVENMMKTSLRLKTDEMYVKKVISPAAAEKLMAKKYPIKWNRVKEYITRTPATLAVAPREDKRESFDPYGDAIGNLPDLSNITLEDLL